jgi:zinc protease
MFQLIYLTFTQPRADAATVATMTAQTKVMLANQQASPEFVFQQALVSALTQDHPRARLMTPAMVDQMNLDRSFAFYKDRFADASDFTFVFAGSFDMEAIKPLVERYLASLPSLKRHETWKNEGIAPPRGIVEKVVRKGIEPKSQAAIVFTGPFPFDTPHEVALDALGIVLEGRLRRSLREALRGTYGVEVQANATKIPEPRYNVAIQFGCDPERTEELVATLLREVERLKADGPTDSEVADAREALMVAYQTDMAENSRLADRLLERYQLSEDALGFFNLPAEYQKLGALGIQDAARRCLDTANYVRVTLFPEAGAGVKK